MNHRRLLEEINKEGIMYFDLNAMHTLYDSDVDRTIGPVTPILYDGVTLEVSASEILKLKPDVYESTFQKWLHDPETASTYERVYGLPVYTRVSDRFKIAELLVKLRREDEEIPGMFMCSECGEVLSGDALYRVEDETFCLEHNSVDNRK